MTTRRPSKHAKRLALPKHAHTVLVLQGGGALGAYQAGVYEGMAERGFAPNWLTGVSIGAVNAALIAGNAPERRLERLQAFWDRVSSGVSIIPPPFLDPLRIAFDRMSAMAASTFGAPGFFVPRVPPPFLEADGSPGALSFYDTSPLRETLVELVDFDLINRKQVRLSVGAVDVHTGNSVYFDNQQQAIGPEHIMASGALPPGFPPVVIDGNHYWDGGLVSNSPLWYVLDDSPDLNALIAQVDLFSATGPLPQNLDEVLERSKDIQYSSKTRFNTNRVKELEALRVALGRLLHKLPAKLHDDPDYQRLAPLSSRRRQLTIVHFINRRLAYSLSAKDYAFSRTMVRQLWEAGLEDVRRSCTNPRWRHAIEIVDGIRVFDLAG
ncbi:MAG TPA: patatin-like phospholipase family protein [Casimicrobiaceae bacterium]|jgi:NTE family protein|nr:patatin-like phospholipase family protein [Casimicrobiaceae bacterium]